MMNSEMNFFSKMTFFKSKMVMFAIMLYIGTSLSINIRGSTLIDSSFDNSTSTGCTTDDKVNGWMIVCIMFIFIAIICICHKLHKRSNDDDNHNRFIKF